jgi:DAK2 domain fusion protein YloV
VAKDMASAARQALEVTDDPYTILYYSVIEAEESVERTPELLDVLKEAGVVDSGGKGLFYIYDGMLRFIQGLPLDTAVMEVRPLSAMNLENAMDAIEPGQDYEVVIDFRIGENFELQSYYDKLEEMGTSIQVGEGDGIYRMHIHVPTEKRYEPIDYTMSLGTITQVHLENLIDQLDGPDHRQADTEITLTSIEPGQIAAVVVAPGIGFSKVFASLGAAAIVEGGQTMNPSTQEIVSAFEDLPTNNIVILPNNKNIFMAAEKATEVTVKNAVVIPSRTLPQGLSAMLRLIPDGNMDEIIQDMKSALDDVETGEITTATRSVEIDGVRVEKGEIIALHNGKLVCSSDNLEDACIEFLELANADDYELITLFYGANTTDTDVNNIAEIISEKYPYHEIEIQNGGQPHYQFIISIE